MKYQIMFYGGLVITIITLILAVISFFKLNAAEALCDLVGINLKKKKTPKIKISKKEYKFNKKDKLSKSTNSEAYKGLDNNEQIEPKVIVDYEKTKLNEESTSLLNDEGTTLLDDENTTLLDDEGTTLLDSDETTIISDEFDETTLLEDDNGFSDSFIKEIDIVLINSNKRI